MPVLERRRVLPLAHALPLGTVFEVREKRWATDSAARDLPPLRQRLFSRREEKEPNSRVKAGMSGVAAP